MFAMLYKIWLRLISLTAAILLAAQPVMAEKSEIDRMSAIEIYNNSYLVGMVSNPDGTSRWDFRELRKLKIGDKQYFLLQFCQGVTKPGMKSYERDFDYVSYMLMDRGQILDLLMMLKSLKKQYPIEGDDCVFDKELTAEYILGSVLLFSKDILFGVPVTSGEKYKNVLIESTFTCCDQNKHTGITNIFGVPIYIGDTEFNPHTDDWYSAFVWFESWDQISPVVELIEKSLTNSSDTKANPDTFRRLGKFNTGNKLYKEDKEVLSFTSKKNTKFYVGGDTHVYEGEFYPSYLWLNSDLLPEFVEWLDYIYTEVCKGYKNPGKIFKDDEYVNFRNFMANKSDGGSIVGSFDVDMNIVSGSPFDEKGVSAYMRCYEGKILVHLEMGKWDIFIDDLQALYDLIGILKQNIIKP